MDNSYSWLVSSRRKCGNRAIALNLDLKMGIYRGTRSNFRSDDTRLGDFQQLIAEHSHVENYPNRLFGPS
jgi:hypothetical protein